MKCKKKILFYRKENTFDCKKLTGTVVKDYYVTAAILCLLYHLCVEI